MKLLILEVRASQLAQASERVGSLISASQQGEAGIREPTLSKPTYAQ